MTAINCPVCQAAFKEVVKEGILIDICTQCKGVWLDRGELEKLLTQVRTDEKSYQPISDKSATQEQPRPEYPNHYYHKPHPSQEDDYYRYKQGHSHYRKKSKLETLFNIFD